MALLSPWSGLARGWKVGPAPVNTTWPVPRRPADAGEANRLMEIHGFVIYEGKKKFLILLYPIYKRGKDL